MTVAYVDSDGSTPHRGPAHRGPALPSPVWEEPMLSIELHTAATSLVIPTIRTVAADLAARADFDLDSIDDLRMAVDDVCAMLVRVATLDATLNCKFTVRAERIELAAEVEADDSADPLPTKSFGWRVLESLADEVSARFLPGGQGQRGRACITLTKCAITVPPT
jgi:serine/threonine-protein kinase RsbW